MSEGLFLHSSGEKYIAYALWLKGHSLPMIAHWTGKRTKQIAGIIARSAWPNRSAMTDEERQVALDELRQIRLDKSGRSIDQGVLNKFNWKIEPLEKVQQRG